MTQPTAPAGGSETLADQSASASSEALREAPQSLTPERREGIGGVLQAVMEPTREATREVVAVTAPEGDRLDQAEQAPRLYSFAEARAFLREHGIDLSRLKVVGGTLDEMSANDVLEAEVRSAIRLGLIGKRGADKYGAQLQDEAGVLGTDLQELVRQLEAHPNLGQRIVLGVDNMTRNGAWKRLIEGPITQIDVSSERFSRYPKVDPATKEPLADQRPSGKAGILFTPDRMNLPARLRGIPTNDQLERMTRGGQRYMGPVGWMRLFREGIDRALPVLFPDEAGDLDSFKPADYQALVNRALLDTRIDPYLLDTLTATQFPDLRLDGRVNGAVPNLCFYPDPDDRLVGLGDCNPYNPHGYLGCRPVLGSFLS